jgi:hypothetical protein
MTGDPWHGPNVASLLARFDARTAAVRPPGGVHSAWEIVLHMTGWAREVQHRLTGRPAQDPDSGDWPAIEAPSQAAWDEACAELFRSHEALADAVRRLPVEVLDTPVSDHRHTALGTGLSRYLTVHGLVHHTVYHAGQLAVVARLLG